MKKKIKIIGASLFGVAVLASLLTIAPQDKSVDIAEDMPFPPRMLNPGNEVAELEFPPRMLNPGNEVAELAFPPRMLNPGNEVAELAFPPRMLSAGNDVAV